MSTSDQLGDRRAAAALQFQYEIEEEEARRQPPFRVLSPGGRILYEPQAVLRSPPPPRAPEPYKVAPQAGGLGRAQRKSSFAIIAETRPPSPQPPDGPPASGRVSPFRGRGFKGPPPRSHSRPHTPDRRGSASQQSSPKRSQIPRPARSRSVSSSKENLDTRKDSPKFGRRAANRYTSSIGNSTAQQRRAPQRDAKLRSELSPIRGTPTKGSPTKNKGSPTKAPTGQRPGAPQRPTKTPDKLNRNLLVPPPRNATGKRFVTAKAPMPRDKSASTEALDSAGSRIPLRQANGANGSTSNLLKVPPAKSTAANSKPANEVNDRAKPGAPTSNGNGPDIVKPIPSKRQSPSTKDSGGGGVTEDDLALVDLLRQSSGATGTSSVVNTTTTTAVQPLQIDAASILPEGELVAKLTSLERKQRLAEARERSPDGPQPEAETPPSGPKEQQQQQQQQQPPPRSKAADVKTPRDGGAKGDVKTPRDGGGARGDAKAARDGGAKANMAQTMIKHFGQGGAEDKGPGRTGEAAGNESKSSPKPDGEKARDEAASKRPVQQEQQQQQQQQEQEKQRQAAAPTGQPKPTGQPAARPDAKAANGSGSRRTSPSPRQRSARAGDKQPATPLGAQAQAVSSESLGSLRSTDTGVSLNTVRGVSSAKEKAGLHLVKRPEEIETLSGNIVHLDRNGEHPPIAARDEAGGGGDGGKGGGGGGRGGGGGAAATGGGAEPPRTRWQRLRSRCPGKLGTGCWPNMRCLACKRDPKAQLWPGKQARAASTAQLTPNAGDAKPSRWSRLKDACRCARLREGRCWRPQRARQPWPSRQQQVVPVDAPVRGCCGGPERGLGALCRKLLGRCSCRPCCRRGRAADQASQRTKSLRAKHSITSVAAPPLSEETRPKIPDVLVEHNSVMRGAIPCLPVPVAWFCLIWNVVVPGSGTIFSGLFNLCMGQPRFSAAASPKARFGALIVNIIVGVSQLFTVLFCLVGWGWSIWWGVTMVRLAGKYKRFKDSEAAANDPEARGAEAGASLPAPGIPTQMLRGVERPAR